MTEEAYSPKAEIALLEKRIGDLEKALNVALQLLVSHKHSADGVPSVPASSMFPQKRA